MERNSSSVQKLTRLEGIAAKAGKRLFGKMGGSSIKAIIIFACLMLIVAFLFEVFIIYTTCNEVSASVERAVMTVASENKPLLFDSLKEGSTYAECVVFMSEKSVSEALCEELGVVEHDDGLELPDGEGGYHYRISELDVEMENTSSTDRTATVKFIATFTLTIPVPEYWNQGSLSVPMRSVSHYTSKY